MRYARDDVDALYKVGSEAFYLGTGEERDRRRAGMTLYLSRSELLYSWKQVQDEQA